MGSLAFYPILSLLIWLGSPLGLLGAMYLALLVELLPALALAQLPLVDVDEPLPREPVYISSSVLILAMGGLGLAIGGVELGWEALGIVSVRWDVWFPWTVWLCLAAFVVLLAFHILRKSFGLREAPFLAQLLPKTPREKLLFFFLSLSAGAGEELACSRSEFAVTQFGMLVDVLPPRHHIIGYLRSYVVDLLTQLLDGAYLLSGRGAGSQEKQNGKTKQLDPIKVIVHCRPVQRR